MSVTYKEIANNLKVPGVYAEIDASLARRGLSGKESVGLIIGQKSDGTAEYNKVYQAADLNAVLELAGAGSEIHRMAAAWFNNNKSNALKIMAVEQKEGVAATFNLTVSADKASAGMINLMIAGYPVRVTVEADATTDILQNALVEAINAETMPVSYTHLTLPTI